MLRRLDGRVWLTLAYLVAGIGNLLFHLVAVRVVSHAAYGQFGASVSLTTLVAVPLGAVEIAFAAAVARGGGIARLGTEPMARRYLSLVGAPVLLGAVVTGAGASVGLAMPWLDAALLAVFFGSASVLVFGRAVLIGGRQWAPAAVVVLTPTGLRFLLLVGVLVAGVRPDASVLLAVTVAGECGGTVVALVATRLRFRPDGRGVTVKGRDLVVSACALGGVALLAGTDVLLARAVMEAGDAGRLAATAGVARAALYLPQAVAFAVLPDLASGTDARAAVVFNRVNALLVAFSVLAVAGAWLVGGPVVGLMLGDRSLAATLPGLTTAAAGAGVAHLAVTAALARRSRHALYPLLFCLALVPAFALVEPHQVVPFAAGLTVSAGLAGVLWFNRRARARPTVQPDVAGSWRLDAPVMVSIVVPAYRPGPGFAVHLRELYDVLERLTAGEFELIVVSDGCPEGSASVASRVATDVGDPGRLRVVARPANGGKGVALRDGLARASGDLVGYIDADGDIGAQHVRLAVASLVGGDADVALGDKTNPASRVPGSRARRLLTFGYGTLTQILFGLDAVDTQAGLKLWRGELLRRAVAGAREDGFAIDLELLLRSQEQAGRPLRIASVPVTIDRRGASTVRARAIVEMLLATIRLRVTSTPRRSPSVRDLPSPEPAATP